MAALSTSVAFCARCRKAGHTNKECDLPFFRQHTQAELRQMRIAEKEKKKAEYEQRVAARAAQQAKWEAEKAQRKEEYEQRQAEREWRAAERAEKQARWEQREASKGAELRRLVNAVKQQHPDDASSKSETESTRSSGAHDRNEAVLRVADLDKQVRKLEKVLREIKTLEGMPSLDKLQKVKVDRKSTVISELVDARDKAISRARAALLKETAAW